MAEIVRMCDISFDKVLFENFLTNTVLDKLLCSYDGLPKGVNYMIIGDPGTGKTTIILDMLANFMRLAPRPRILFVSAEMNEIDLSVYVQRFPKFQYINILFIESDVNLFVKPWAEGDSSLCHGEKRCAKANLLDLHVRRGDAAVPFVAILDILLRKRGEISLLHAKAPGQNLSDELKNYPGVWEKVCHILCPRVHFKMMIFDGAIAYIGSANLTGAGIGMKNSSRRNFECGILTNAPLLVSAASEHFNGVFNGKHCRACGRKGFCKMPIPKRHIHA